MSQEAKDFIQAASLERFPAQELWIHPDNRFWAFDINDDKITFTEGFYENGCISFNNTTLNIAINNEDAIDPYIEQIRNEGFECFAIQLRM